MNLDLRRVNDQSLNLGREISSTTKSQLITLLICVVASALVAPSQVVAATIDGTEHLICVKLGQHLICDPEAKTNQELVANNDSQIKGTIVRPFNSAQQDFLANTFLWLSYLLPGSLALGLFLHDRYAGYRMAVLSNQIQTLERSWRHSHRS